MEIVVISGKGGTGKTSLTGSLAAMAENPILVDCDVDAADLHLILDVKKGPANDFSGGSRAEINYDLCDNCGICADVCRFDAIRNIDQRFTIDDYSCEGCGVCHDICPVQAITMKKVISGHWFVSKSQYGPLIHARLGIAEGNSGKLVSLLRKEAEKLQEKGEYGITIIDGPPGIGCPVIASLTGADYILIVTEPSVSAFHDLERLMKLIKHFNIPAGICINKYDTNRELTDKIREFTGQSGFKTLGILPYEPGITKAQIKGVPYIEYSDGEVADNIRLIWSRLNQELENITENVKTKDSLTQIGIKK